jgi:hypothetical protein
VPGAGAPPSGSTPSRGLSALGWALLGSLVVLAIVAILAVLAGVGFARTMAKNRSRAPGGTGDAGPRVSDRRVLLPERRLSNEERLELFRVLRRNSALVLARGKQGTYKGSASVFKRLGDNCILATNAHVLLESGAVPMTDVLVITKKDQSLRAYPVWVVERREVLLDLAFLLVRDPAGALGQEVPMARDVHVGEPVIAVGNPLEEEFLVTEGAVQSVRDGSWAREIVHDALIEHGSSGGGLFNLSGELLGINTYLREGRLGIATCAQSLLEGARFYHALVKAKADWQDSGIMVPAGAEVSVFAMGSWTLGFLAGSSGPAGISGYENYRVSPEHPHGALIGEIGREGSIFAVNREWPDASWGREIGLSPPIRAPAVGSLRFRVNDTDFQNNGGTADCTVIVWMPGAGRR